MTIEHLSPSRRIVYEEMQAHRGKRYKRVGPDTERLAEQHGYNVETLAQSLVDLAGKGLISKERTGREVLYFLADEKALTAGATLRLTVTFARGEDGYVIASVPALPGCHSQGRTLDEARRNIREAARGYVAGLQYWGENTPEELRTEQLEIPA